MPEYCLNCEGVCGAYDPLAACTCQDCTRCNQFAKQDLEKWFGVAKPTQYINPTGGGS